MRQIVDVWTPGRGVTQAAWCFKCNEVFSPTDRDDMVAYERTGMCPKCREEEGELITMVRETRDLCKLILEKMKPE